MPAFDLWEKSWSKTLYMLMAPPIRCSCLATRLTGFLSATPSSCTRITTNLIPTSSSSLIYMPVTVLSPSVHPCASPPKEQSLPTHSSYGDYIKFLTLTQFLRASGVTSLAENSVQSSIIQAMGRWAPDAFKIYVQNIIADASIQTS